MKERKNSKSNRWLSTLLINEEKVGFGTNKLIELFCRELLKKEGMFLGNSAGAAIKGVLQLKENFKPEDLVVVLFHDHGSRYLKKIYNDDWMSKMGYI